MSAPNPKPIEGQTALKTEPHILLIYTGGTIGMTADASGQLVPFNFAHLMESIPKVGKLPIRLDHLEMDPIIDSSNATVGFWVELARIIAESYNTYDGFVVLHGTDTMAYTSSALSFMLQGLEKPVIITGSQLPVGAIREDGTENLITALQIAVAQTSEANSKSMVQEVAISFGRNLLRGNRATKVSSTNFGAYASPNFPALASIDLDIDFAEDLLLRPNAPFSFNPHMEEHVSVIWIDPATNEETLAAHLNIPHLKGVILRTYGAGNAPTAPWFVNQFKQAVERGISVVNVSQCINGGVQQRRYETGAKLANAGVISGLNLTVEAALCKLMHLLAKPGITQDEVACQMQRPIAGEVGHPYVIMRES